MGTASEYNTKVGFSSSGNTSVKNYASAIAIGLMTYYVTQDLRLSLGVVPAAIADTSASSLLDGIAEFISLTGDPYRYIDSIPYTQTKYSSRYPGCYRIERVYELNSYNEDNDDVVVVRKTVNYYIMYQ